MERSSSYIRRRSSAYTSAKAKQDIKKIIVLGSTKCGKTAFVQRFLDNSFPEEYTPTIEDYYEKDHVYKGSVLNLEIVDTCGPFMFPVMRDINIRSAEVAMVLYEINKEASMQEASNLLLKIKELRGNEKPLHVVLVGTKFDLFKDNVGKVLASCNEHFSIMPNWEQNHQLTSAKNNVNVTYAFDQALDYILSSTPRKKLKKTESNHRHEKTKSCATQ